MYRTLSAILASVLLSTVLGETAFAQGTMEQENACRGDVFRLCASYIPDVGQIVACLRGNESRLSEACHDVMFEPQPVATGQYSAPQRSRSDWAR